MMKLSTTPFLKFFKHLKTYYFTCLFTAWSSSACINHEFTQVEELFDIWNGFQQSAVDGERVLAPAHGPNEDNLSSDNMLIE